MSATTIATLTPIHADDLEKIGVLHLWLHLHLRSQLSVACLARQAGMNANKMQKIFRARYGMGIMTYVRTRRLLRARYQLEHTSTNIKTAAAEAGYKRISAFTHAFHVFHGVTPGKVSRLSWYQSKILTNPV